MKDLSTLESWNMKQLRNLRINLNNRLQSFKNSHKPKELQKSHILFGMDQEQCEQLLIKVKRTEKQKLNE